MLWETNKNSKHFYTIPPMHYNKDIEVEYVILVCENSQISIGSKTFTRFDYI